MVESIDGVERHRAATLLPLVYEELRKLAKHKMAGEPSGHTLQPTALVHEAYLRLYEAKPNGWANRAEFFAAAAESMRRILVDRARRHGSLKRGGDWKKVGHDVADPVVFHYSIERSCRFSIGMIEESAEPLPPGNPA